MSRCFPFPPPGYEKKPRTDDTDILKKEKHKEKKHKKDKRDKGKKEGKEKREEDRSDGKHREKKDRKEKNREKKKDKKGRDKDKDRDKGSISEEKRVGGQQGYNGEKIHPREELDKEKNSRSDETTAARLYQGEHGEKPVHNSNALQETEDAKYVQELGRRIRSDKGAGSSQPAERFNIMDQRMDDAVDRSSVRDIGILSEVKNKEKKVDTRKMDDQRIWDEAIVGGIAKAATLAGMAQNRFEGTPPLEKKTDKKIEEKEKSRDKEGVDEQEDKRKNKDWDKQSRGKDKDGEKEKKKEEKAKEKSERKKTEKDKVKLSNKNDIIGAPSHISGAPNHIFPQPSHSVKTGINEGNLKKRKEMETNGFSYDHEPKPNKMERLAAHPMSENERKLETYQSPSLLASNIQEASPIKLNADNKEHKRNGIIAASPVSVSKPKIPSSSSSNHIAQSFPVSMTKPSSTFMTVSTAKLPSACATENAAAMISISAMKPSSAIANELAASVMPLVAVKPSTTSANVIAAQSISIRKPSSGSAKENAAQVASVSTKKPSSATHNENAKVYMRPPHPDSKHLKQILTVPKMEEWSDFDEQEWLFGSKDAPLKKPEVPSVRVHEELQVWAEALKIESADVYALPYVVPY